MRRVSHPISFLVGEDTFELTDTLILKNGRIIAEGKIYPFNIILGQPACIVVTRDDTALPIYIMTQDNVTGVLPIKEVFEGISYPQKYTYLVKYLQKGLTYDMYVHAVDLAHAKGLCRDAKGEHVDIVSVEKTLSSIKSVGEVG
ncbi:hypothetical protein [Pontibacillus halophilus]|uniref:hypothetical protein n=1 Tax=Pontibacillus halophilus TaxID=516704 RepID=UPI0004042B9F|nr:hypothetical protein [Pontibacillus halophilus]